MSDNKIEKKKRAIENYKLLEVHEESARQGSVSGKR
jgi:hypothetical protein